MGTCYLIAKKRLYSTDYITKFEVNVTFKQNSDNVFVAYQNRLNLKMYLKVKLNLAT